MTHPELLLEIKHAKITKSSVGTVRQQLTQKGWDRLEVDTALWHAGFKDRKNHYARNRYGKIAIAVLICFGLLVIIGGSLLVDRFYKQNGLSPSDDKKTVDVGSLGGTVTSEAAGIAFSFPSDWELKSKPDGTPGLYAWQVEPLTNRDAREKIAQQYEQNTANPSLDTSSLAILAGSGGETVYAVTITVYKTPEYPLETSLEIWKTKMIEQQTSNGYTVDGFQKTSINGREAYTFSSHIGLSQLNLSTTGYVILEKDRRIEITVLPEKSDRILEINGIINSLRIL